MENSREEEERVLQCGRGPEAGPPPFRPLGPAPSPFICLRVAEALRLSPGPPAGSAAERPFSKFRNSHWHVAPQLPQCQCQAAAAATGVTYTRAPGPGTPWARPRSRRSGAARHTQWQLTGPRPEPACEFALPSKSPPISLPAARGLDVEHLPWTLRDADARTGARRHRLV